MSNTQRSLELSMKLCLTPPRLKFELKSNTPGFELELKSISEISEGLELELKSNTRGLELELKS